MKKIDPAVKKETLYVLIWTVILSVMMEAVFLIIGKWDVTVLFGNLLGAAATVGNFFLLGLTVQSALEKDEKGANGAMRLSQSLRFLMMIVVAAVGYALPVFNVIAVVIPFLFVRIAIAFRPLFSKKKGIEK